MLKLLLITLITLLNTTLAENPHSEKSTSTADTTAATRVLVSPKTNFTLSSVQTDGNNSTVVLELWTERMISGKTVAPADSGRRALNEHGESKSADVAPAMSYTYRMNGKLYVNDQNLYLKSKNGIV